jgi:hypothetical protein
MFPFAICHGKCFRRNRSRISPLSKPDILFTFVSSGSPTPIVALPKPAERSSGIFPIASFINRRSLRVATRDSVMILKDSIMKPRSSVTLPRSSKTIPKSFAMLPQALLGIVFAPESSQLLTPVAMRNDRRRSFRPDMFSSRQSPKSKD